MDQTKYPKRDSHFAHRVVRLMAKTCAAQEIGPEAVLIVTFIVHTEDAKHYRGPVTYYNEQLMPIVGMTTYKRFTRARTKAIEAGWLHYEPGGKNRPGRYWATIPEDFGGVPDGPTDESDQKNTYVESTQQSSEHDADLDRSNRPNKQDSTGELPRSKGRSKGKTNGRGSDLPFDPSPSPIPKESNSRRRGPTIRILAELNKTDQLADVGFLLELHKRLARAPDNRLKGGDREQQDFVALALRYRSDDDVTKPCALFVTKVREGDFSDLLNGDEDRAERAIREYRRQQARASPVAKNAAASLKSTD